MRDKPLSVAIVNGVLTISIGVDTLMVAAKGGDAWDETLQIENVDGFARDIVDELEREAEDGTTLVHVAIDSAIERALEDGSLNVNYGVGEP